MNEDEQRSQYRRRHYDEEFKRNAVELLEAGGRSAVQLSRELGVSDCSLGKWKRQYGQYGQQGRDALSASEATQSRIEELERELAAVSRQRDILKKALAILGQEPNNFTK